MNDTYSNKSSNVDRASIGLRYITLIVSSSIAAVLSLTVLPYAVVFSPLFQILSAAVFLVALVLYCVRGTVAQRRANSDDFIKNLGMHEVLLGITLGVMLSAELTLISVIAPYALMYAFMTTLMVFVSLGVFAAITRIKRKNDAGDEVARVQGVGAVVLLLALIGGFVIGGGFVLFGITGVSILPYIAEMCLAGFAALALLGNIFQVISGREDVNLLGGKLDLESPMLSALVVFMNTADLFVSLARAFMFKEKSKQSRDRVKPETARNFVIGGACIAGMCGLIYAVYKGDDILDSGVACAA